MGSYKICGEKGTTNSVSFDKATVPIEQKIIIEYVPVVVIVVVDVTGTVTPLVVLIELVVLEAVVVADGG